MAASNFPTKGAGVGVITHYVRAELLGSEGGKPVIATVTLVAPHTPTPTGPPQTIVLGAAATGVDGGGTIAIPDDTTHVMVSVFGGDVQFTEDGVTVPTTTVGTRLLSGFIGELPLARQLNFIRVAAGTTIQLAPRKYV